VPGLGEQGKAANAASDQIAPAPRATGQTQNPKQSSPSAARQGQPSLMSGLGGALARLASSRRRPPLIEATSTFLAVASAIAFASLTPFLFV
jgi:hypothetical protein